MNLDLEIIAKNIKKYRKQNNWTQKQLAGKIGRGHSTVRHYECAYLMPSSYIINILAEVFGISIIDLLTDKDIMK